MSLSWTGVQIGTLAIAMSVSVVTCGFWVRFATARSIADAPGQRRMHQHVTPRGGGVGIALALILMLGGQWWAMPGSTPSWASGPGICLLGIAIAAMAGLLDDFRRIGTGGKFLLQVVAAFCIALAWLQMSWPWMLVGAAALLTVLVLINFWNFMDGANGIAATQAVLVALALAIATHQPGTRLLALTLLASSAGFLPFNLPRARLFMGDIGSHVIGACLAMLILREVQEHVLSLFQAFILVSAVTMDAGLTLLRRIIRGRRFWQAHREHLYQMAIRKGLSHGQVCLAYAAWTGVAALVTLAISNQAWLLQAAAAAATATLATVIYIGLRQRWLSRRNPARVQS